MMHYFFIQESGLADSLRKWIGRKDFAFSLNNNFRFEMDVPSFPRCIYQLDLQRPFR